MENEQEQQQQTFVEQLLQLIEQLISPEWPGLIALLPLLFIGLIVLIIGFLAWQWRQAGRRNRSRVPRPLAAGAPPPGIHLPGPSRWPFVLPIGAALILFALIVVPREDTGQPAVPVNLPLLGLGLLVTLVAVGGWLLDAMREWRAASSTSHAVAGALAPGSQPVGALQAGGTAMTTGVPRRQPPPEPPPGVHMPGPSPWPFFAPIGIALILFGLIVSPALILGGLILAIIAAAGWLREAGHEYRSTERVGHAVPLTRDPVRAWPGRLVAVFVAVTVLSALVALAPLGLHWLGSLAPLPDGEATPEPVPAVPEIAASNSISFQTDLLVVPCCRPFELIFHNLEEGVPHDVAISVEEGADALFDGEEITGTETITYEVPELAEGDYYFYCTVHPNMNGTLEAVPENGDGGDGGDGGEGGDGGDGGGAGGGGTPAPSP